MIGDDGRRMLQAELRERLEETRYPSGEFLDRYEQSIRTTNEAITYADLLLERATGKYPSLALIDRVHYVMAAIDLAERKAESQNQG